MDAERFAQLISAYGAAPDRWPEGEREAALAFMAADRPRAERLLFEARMIDAALDASPAAQPSQALRAAILAAAPPPRPERRSLFGWTGVPGWAAGAGLAAACAVGVLTGVVAVESLSAESPDTLIAQAYETPADVTEILG